MDTKKVAKEMVANAGNFKDEILNYIATGKALYVKIITTYADQILVCTDEAEFLHLMADLADELHEGNIFTEQVDGPVIYQVLKLSDRFVLDKFFGVDWFIKVQELARKAKEA